MGCGGRAERARRASAAVLRWTGDSVVCVLSLIPSPVGTGVAQRDSWICPQVDGRGGMKMVGEGL